jgi:hypothetical protein
MDDAPERVVGAYLASIRGQQSQSADGLSLEGHPGRWKTMDSMLRLTHCRISGPAGRVDGPLASGLPCRVMLSYKTTQPLRGARVNFAVIFRDASSRRIASCWSQISSQPFEELGDMGQVQCDIPRLPLVPGRYAVDIGCQVASAWSDMIYEATAIDVGKGPFYPSDRLPTSDAGSCLMEYVWSVPEPLSEHPLLLKGVDAV